MKRRAIFYFIFLMIPVFIFSMTLDEIDSRLLGETDLNSLEEEIRRQSPKENSLLKAELELRRARLYRILGEKEKSTTTYRELYNKIQNNEYSINQEMKLLLMAETLGEVMVLEGVASIISNGSKVQGFAEEVIGINPENKRALLLIIESMINAPRLFGGDPSNAISKTETLLENESNEIFLFRGYLLKATAYLKLKKKEKADKEILRAETIFPNNSDLIKLRNEL